MRPKVAHHVRGHRRALGALAAALLAACPGPKPADQPPAASADSTPVAAPAEPSPALEGPEWKLVELGGGPVAPQERNQPGFRLVADGHKVQGSAGCNRMMGSYTLDGSSLKFGPIASTRMACPSMETETKFLAALNATTRYEVAGSNLTLYGGDAPVARLEATSSPSPAAP
jgi:heat shock protein HslJ